MSKRSIDILFEDMLSAIQKVERYITPDEFNRL